jgi:hypothetical protein
MTATVSTVAVVNASARQPDAPRREDATAPLIALAVTNVVTALLVIVSTTALWVGHREQMESGIYLIAFVLAPLAVAAGRYQRARLRRWTASRLAVLNVSALALVLIGARISAEVGDTTLGSCLLLAGGLIVAGANIVALHRRGLPSLSSDSPTEGSGSILGASALAVGAAFALYPPAFFALEKLWLCLALSGVVVMVWLALPRAVAIGARRRRGIDAIVVGVTVLAVTNITNYSADYRYDYDFFLGPVNAMRHGHPLLVDTVSQYGVGMFYFLEIAFDALPLTYGGLQAILCFLYAIEFTLVYAVLRISCRSQLVAVSGLAIAVVANLAGPVQPHVGYPSTGPLRFGLPWVVILAGTLLARSRVPRRSLEALMLVTVAVAAVWSIETFLYCFAAYTGVVVIRYAYQPWTTGRRARAIVLRLAAAAAAALVSTGAVSLSVRAVAGAWPDWTSYLDLIVLYTTRGFGTTLIPAWSPGYLVASIYVGSLLVLVALPRRFAVLYQRELAAIAGATAFGATAFSYYLGRSVQSNLHHVAIPAVVVLCGWWTLAHSQGVVVRRAHVWGPLLAASFLATSLVVSNAGATRTWLESSSLVHVIRSPEGAFAMARQLLDAHPRDRNRVAVGSALLRRYARSDAPPAVLVRADLLTSVLLAARLGNALPIANGNQDGLLGESALKKVRKKVDTLPAGTIVLTERVFMRRPSQSFVSLDPIRAREQYGDYFISRSFEALRTRRELHVISRGRSGFVVFELGRRL